jgi:hypothetical protein
MPRAVLTLIGAATLALTFVSTSLHPRFEHRAEVIAQQFAILQGSDYEIGGERVYFGQFQNRILFPLLLVTLTTTGVSPAAGYVVLTVLLTCAGLFLVAWAVWRFTGSGEQTLLALALFALARVFTFNHGWDHPSDTLDVVTFALAVPWVVADRFRSVLVLALVASANRESSVFLAVIWAAVWFSREGPSVRRLKQTAVLGFVAAASVYLLRLGLGGSRALVGPTTWWSMIVDSAIEALRHPSQTAWPILLLGLLAVLAVACRGPWTRDERALVVAAVFVAGLSALGGLAYELRIFVPAVTIAILAGALGEGQRTTLVR